MTNAQPYHIKTVSEFHQFRKLGGPKHPLISVVQFEQMRELGEDHPRSWVLDFYAIALKRDFGAKLKYGQQVYDFDEGIMTFMAPGQKIGIEADADTMLRHSGWLLIFHPDFLWHTPLARKIRQYEYFDYAVHEALFLSEQEESIITGILQNIRQEYERHLDSFTQNIIVGIVINMMFVYIVLKNTERLEKLFGKSGLNVLRKAFGVILLAIAIKLFRNNTGL